MWELWELKTTAMTNDDANKLAAKSVWKQLQLFACVCKSLRNCHKNSSKMTLEICSCKIDWCQLLWFARECVWQFPKSLEPSDSDSSPCKTTFTDVRETWCQPQSQMVRSPMPRKGKMERAHRVPSNLNIGFGSPLHVGASKKKANESGIRRRTINPTRSHVRTTATDNMRSN